MRSSGTKMITKPVRHLFAIGVATLAFGLGNFEAQAASQNVVTDPGDTFFGYENVYTNGLNSTAGTAYVSKFLGAGGSGTSFPNNSSVDSKGTLTIGADDWPDVTAPYNTDTLIWADASGTSAAICKTLSDIYTENAGFNAGDSVTFTGTLATNTLVSPYREGAILFIKDYDADYVFHGYVALNLNTLTNGQAFSLTLPAIFGTHDHIQYGLEWAGPPVRGANAATYGMAMVSTNGGYVPPPTNVYVGVDPSQAWAGYRNVTDQIGANYGPASGYIGVGGQTLDFQASISSQGVVQCAPDISLDVYFHNDINIWSDTTTNLSPAVANYDNTFYVDSTTSGARGGDTVVFSGTLVTNALTDIGMSSSLVAFIKDYGSDWTPHATATVLLSSLTNGQTFTITDPIFANGDHVQWGFEWQGIPARTNPAAANFVGQYGYVIFSSNSVVTPGPQILSVNPSVANVTMGSNATFAVNASGSGLTYHWSKNGVNVTDGGGVSGSATSTLSFTSVKPAQGGVYKVVVTDSGNLSATNSVSLIVYNPSFLYFDRALAPFNGFINAWNGTNLISTPPASGLAGTAPKASFGFGVTPTSLVRATMNTANDVITLQPNTYVYDTNPGNPAYINPDGSAAAYLEQDYYIQNDSIAGDVLTFSGYCSSNSLNSKYTARAFIKDGSPDWSVEHRYDAPLKAGQPFNVSFTSTPGDHIQYGFGIWGPDNSATNPITQGAVEVKVYSPIGSVSNTGTNLNLSFPTVINHSYAVQYTTNLTSGTWNTLTTTNGTGVNVAVPDTTTGSPARFYRLQTQ